MPLKFIVFSGTPCTRVIRLREEEEIRRRIQARKCIWTNLTNVHRLHKYVVDNKIVKQMK